MIKNVFLDLDDTILDFQGGERRAIGKTLNSLALPSDAATVEKYIEINLRHWRALERSEMSKREVLLGRFERLFDHLGVKRCAAEAQRIYESHLACEHDFLPGSEELLRDLIATKKYRLYLATNGIPEVQKPRIAALGLERYFDGIFISEEIGYAKPRKEYFDACASRIEGYAPAETIIVGDSLTSDIQGGINAGILTCHFNPTGKPYEGIMPHYTIKNLSELIPLLDSIK